ncbi:MAG: integrase family protein [Rubrivivax sp.]|nr:integrase family protein [Rubrivivax sp.]
MKTASKTPRTDAAIAKLPPASHEMLMPFGGSLYLKRRPNGRQTWVLRTRMGGTWQVRQLGDWPTVGLHLARQRAQDGRIELAPTLPDNNVSHALATFKREYIATRYRTEGARKESGAMLDRALAGVAGRNLSSLRRLDLTTAVQALADRPNTASKSLALMKQFTGWATARGLLDVDPLGGVTAGRLGLQSYAPRERVLGAAELRALWQRTDPDAHALRFGFLTACRIGEALQWVPDQVAGDIWTIPETKSGRPHTVPLTPEAAALLPLPNPRPVYVSLAQRLKRSGATWTAHDLRRTAATMMREAGVPVHDVEAVLNHAPPRLVRVYQRHDPLAAKAAALAALAERLDEILRGEP